MDLLSTEVNAYNTYVTKKVPIYNSFFDDSEKVYGLSQTTLHRSCDLSKLDIPWLGLKS